MQGGAKIKIVHTRKILRPHPYHVTPHSNKSKISYTFAPNYKEICRKHYIIEQISGSLHEIQLYNVQFMYIFCYRKFNFFYSAKFNAATQVCNIKNRTFSALLRFAVDGLQQLEVSSC